jgi:hypothetical protein
MRKVSLFLLLLTSFGISASYAGFQQNVQVCLVVKDNAAPFVFKADFRSSDFFDPTRETSGLESGSDCVRHVYRSGPKNITLDVYATSKTFNDVELHADESCAYMKHVKSSWLSSGWVMSDTIGTSKGNEIWNFYIKKIGKDLYQLSCVHKSF